MTPGGGGGTTWPEPIPGLVVRYAYLWEREAAAGREEGTKERPCAVVIAVEGAAAQEARGVGRRRRVLVLPVTHSEPRPPGEEGVELPPQVKALLGLDEARSWVVVSEANDFAWPGPDLRPAPGGGPGSAAYGVMPPGLFRVVRDRFLARARARRAALVARTE